MCEEPEIVSGTPGAPGELAVAVIIIIIFTILPGRVAPWLSRLREGFWQPGCSFPLALFQCHLSLPALEIPGTDDS